MENAVVTFENKYMVTMQKIADLEKTIKELDDTKKKVRAELQEAMEFYGIRSVDNDILTMSLVAPSVSTTIDTTALRMEDPDTYDRLIEVYPKTTERRASVRIKIK